PGQGAVLSFLSPTRRRARTPGNVGLRPQGPVFYVPGRTAPPVRPVSPRLHHAVRAKYPVRVSQDQQRVPWRGADWRKRSAARPAPLRHPDRESARVERARGGSRWRGAEPLLLLTMAPGDDARAELAAALAAAGTVVAREHTGTARGARPKAAARGDYASNAAMHLAGALKRPPREIASRILAALPAVPCLEKAEIAGAGFINLFLKDSYKQAAVGRILTAGARYGRSETGRDGKVQVEFVSANPTGPLHVGHGRQAALPHAL